VLATIPLQTAKKNRPNVEPQEEMDEMDLYDLSDEILDDKEDEIKHFYTDKKRFQYQKNQEKL
jgi:hypothetical protein